mgnify:CR=1 FL=1
MSTVPLSSRDLSTRLRHDLDFFVSIGLLATASVTALTGLISDLWDLNDFWYHTVSGYMMGAFAIAHVAPAGLPLRVERSCQEHHGDQSNPALEQGAPEERVGAVRARHVRLR